MKNLNQFTSLYPLSKTLRFELKPIGKTLENIKERGLLNQDEHRANSYVEVKEIIDNYHKALIERILGSLSLNNEEKETPSSMLEEYLFYYLSKAKNEADKEKFKKVQGTLRKIIADSFKKDLQFKRLFSEKLIKEDLLNFVTDDTKRNLILEFKEFTTYFTGFHENRKNMYSDEEKSTAISYRLIHENLPRFIDNMMVFDKIANSPVSNHFGELYENFESYLNVYDLSEMFKLDYFNIVLPQTQIDVYNAVIGGKVLGDGTKIKGLNEYINLHNQQQKDKSQRLPKFRMLYKQILSDRNAISWLPEEFNSDKHLLESVEQFYQNIAHTILQGENSLKSLLLSLCEYDLSKIYIRNDQQLTTISKHLYGEYDVIEKSLLANLKSNVKRKNESDESYEERLKSIIRSQGSFSLMQINHCIQSAYPEEQRTLQTYFSQFGASTKGEQEREDLFFIIEKAYNDAKDLLNTDYPTDKNLAQDKVNVEIIKTLLDAIKSLQWFAKPLLGDGAEPEKDEKFYGEFVILWEELDKITPLYNMVRNYMTRKPYSIEKIKLNFENSTLMDGWDLNKERDNTTVILRKDGLYYLAIMNRHHNKVFDTKNLTDTGECYEKMEYKQIADAGKDIQNIILQGNEYRRFTKNLDNLKQQFIPDIYEIRKKESYKQGNSFSKKDLNTFIDYYKVAAQSYWSWCDFKFLDTPKYSTWKDFTDHINRQGYKVTFRNVSVSYIDQLVEEGKIYLFQIYNKDFSPYSKGTPNMHTLYWRMLFDERNLRDVVYKLNGQAEVFFRKSSLKYERPTHPANEPIENKNSLNNKKQSVFPYDLTKNRRYTIDKFQFHVPITMNFKSTGNENINTRVREHIQQSEDLHIIGIDRGERHLLYLTVIDLKGNIKEQYSLNEIVNEYQGNTYRTNYHDLLTTREKERMKARQSWQTIETIKELKEGYLSQVVHKISELMVKHHAIVVLEDLNMGFKRGRQKFESSVYQKFEKMLIDKLNYLVDKKKAPEEIGGVLQAYQLTSKFESFRTMGKQNGFLFYIPAWNTSKIDPVTGFVNLFDTRYETREKSKDFFGKFESIRYNAEKDWFEFAFDYSLFTSKAYGTRTRWTLCTYGKRIETFRGPAHNSQWVSKETLLTERFKELFSNNSIDIRGDLKSSIIQQETATFFKDLLGLLKLTLQIRNSKSGTETDYMLSPVADANGTFFNSETCDHTLPQNADANGAYNIARKGLFLVRKIKSASDLKDLNLTVTNKEWLNFVQEKPYLNE